MNYIQTSKFLNNSISVRTILPFNFKRITMLNLLVSMMQMKTEKFPSKNQIAIRFGQLYSFRYSAHLTGIGNQVLLDQRFQYLQNRALPHHIDSDHWIEIIDQFLFHVLMDTESFEEAKFLLRDRLCQLQDDPETSAMSLCFSLLSPTHTVSHPLHGSLEDFEHIKFEDCVSFLHQIQSAPKKIYICGQVDSQILSYFSKIEEFDKLSRTSNLYKEVTDTTTKVFKPRSQSILSLAYSTGIDVDSDDYMAEVLAVSILGQCTNNLLFRSIREQNSLCYSVYASLIHFDGIMTIQVGTSREHIDRVMELIDEQMDVLVKGIFPSELLECAKKEWVDSIRFQQDDPFGLINKAFREELLKDTFTDISRITLINALSKDQISHAASKFKRCAVAIVEGTLNEES